ncbi:NHL domain-containing protein [Flavobacterium psychrotolerans]|uniref:Uncharacterized protein n=1 Tax=Flavobacterium psychrotolerans TaxID=2169410 RepID=A0A2U1JGT6_9FLAO|nr:T9SS type A sorting domain-containing protein [Flavobacterium psychrotolerans]PWA04341.1 hypothetical protein DB895_11325 [Flavobacterium psychrotolerans]
MKKFFLITILFNLTTQAQQVSTLAGSIQGYADGTGSQASLNAPRGIAIDAGGNLYFCDTQNNRIRKVTQSGIVTTIAGSTQGYADGIGTSAQFYNPIGIALDSNGNIFIADTSNNRIRKITPDGVVSTYAGSTVGDSDGIGSQVHFQSPNSVTVDKSGNVYVCDGYNQKIKKIALNGQVTTIAGSTEGYADGIGTAAKFYYPFNIFLDTHGVLYIADNGNYKIRKMTIDGTVSTVAGSTLGYQDGLASTSQFFQPIGLTVDLDGNIYVGDRFNYKIRKISPNGIVSTVAGSSQGFADGFGNTAKFNLAEALVTDQYGTLYVTDANNYRIRKITLPPLNVEDNNLSTLNMKIYPNPTHKILNIELTNMLYLFSQIVITDIRGKKLFSQYLNFKSVSLDMSNYSKGIYFVSLIGKNNTISQRFILN